MMFTFLLLLTACGPSPEATAPAATPAPAAHDHAAMGHDGHAGHAPLPAAEPITGASIYQLPVALTDATGAAAKLDLWAGHPVLVAMIYTSCAAACPLIISEMKAIDQALSPAARAEQRYLLISMDPARDTPAALAEMSSRHNLDERWAALGSDEDGVRQIAAVLGVRYRPLPEGGFNHSAVLTLLDREGQIAQRIDGLGQANAALVARADALARHQP